MVERVMDELGRIDILVNNAGINVRKPPHILEIEEWQSVIDTNLTSAFLCSKAVYPVLKARWRRQDHQYRRDDVDLRRELSRRPMPQARAASCSSRAL
jgi:NAD(P)-dependent dehydrogenase (short-subunit alcohol dehydrogenase family)